MGNFSNSRNQVPQPTQRHEVSSQNIARQDLQTCLTPALKRQKTYQHTGCNEQRTANIHRRRRLQIRINRNDRSHNTENAVRTRRQRIPCPSVLGRKDLRCIGIQHRVHDIAHEIVRAIPSQQAVGGFGRRTPKEKDSRQCCGESEGALAPELGDFDKDTAEQGARDPEHGDDEGITIGDIGGAVAVGGAPAAEEVRDEGVVKGKCQADEGPDDHDQRGGIGELACSEESPDMIEIDLFQFTFEHCRRVGALVAFGIVDFQVGDGEG